MNFKKRKMAGTKEEVLAIYALLKSYTKNWAICGGWALSLWLEEEGRLHGDVDIAVFREDNVHLYDFLQPQWQLNYIDEGTEIPWEGQSLYLPIHQIRARRENRLLSQLELLMNESEHGTWIYRRDPRITRAIQDTILESQAGIPILAPEIVLLFKSKYSSGEKHQLDFDRTVPHFDDEQRHWLSKALTTIFVDHPWLRRL